MNAVLRTPYIRGGPARAKESPSDGERTSNAPIGRLTCFITFGSNEQLASAGRVLKLIYRLIPIGSSVVGVLLHSSSAVGQVRRHGVLNRVFAGILAIQMRVSKVGFRDFRNQRVFEAWVVQHGQDAE